MQRVRNVSLVQWVKVKMEHRRQKKEWRETESSRRTSQRRRRRTVLLVSRQQATSVAVMWPPIWFWFEQAGTGPEPLKHKGKAQTSILQKQLADSLFFLFELSITSDPSGCKDNFKETFKNKFLGDHDGQTCNCPDGLARGNKLIPYSFILHHKHVICYQLDTFSIKLLTN